MVLVPWLIPALVNTNAKVHSRSRNTRSGCTPNYFIGSWGDKWSPGRDTNYSGRRYTLLFASIFIFVEENTRHLRRLISVSYFSLVHSREDFGDFTAHSVPVPQFKRFWTFLNSIRSFQTRSMSADVARVDTCFDNASSTMLLTFTFNVLNQLTRCITYWYFSKRFNY